MYRNTHGAVGVYSDRGVVGVYMNTAVMVEWLLCIGIL